MRPVSGFSLPILFAFCSVNHREPSGATAGSWGSALAVGSSYSLMSMAKGAASAQATFFPDARTSSRRAQASNLSKVVFGRVMTSNLRQGRRQCKRMHLPLGSGRAPWHFEEDLGKKSLAGHQD